MNITLEDEDRLVEHKFWVRLRTGKIVNDCMCSRPQFTRNGDYCSVAIPHEEFGHVRVEFSLAVIMNAMTNGVPLYV